MKKVYVKPILIKLGNLESFIKGTGGSSIYMDIYTNGATCIPFPNHPAVTKVECGDNPVGTPNACSSDPFSNYFVFTKEGNC